MSQLSDRMHMLTFCSGCLGISTGIPPSADYKQTGLHLGVRLVGQAAAEGGRRRTMTMTIAITIYKQLIMITRDQMHTINQSLIYSMHLMI
jgi:hypothetical protein